MKLIKFIFLVLAALIFICNETYAQQNDEVTLVVSADGSTKDEAIKTALRSAIEQAYGTFVSTNTTILNDELVKDEIVTISTGNIKNYKEISENKISDNRFFVTLEATVSISKLVSYAQSKGAETEFAGATFAMNIKMKELNKQNEKIAFDNMLKQLELLPSSLFDYSIKLNEPYLKEDNVLIEGHIFILYTDICKNTIDYIWKTLNSLSLTNAEIKEYTKQGLSYYKLNFPRGDKIKEKSLTGVLSGNGYYIDKVKQNPVFYFRNSYSNFDISKWITSKIRYIIYDNIDTPTKADLNVLNVKEKWLSNNIYPYCVEGRRDVRRVSNTYSYNLLPCKLPKIGDEVGEIKIRISIPKNDINKYSNFGVKSVPANSSN